MNQKQTKALLEHVVDFIQLDGVRTQFYSSAGPVAPVNQAIQGTANCWTTELYPSAPTMQPVVYRIRG